MSVGEPDARRDALRKADRGGAGEQLRDRDRVGLLAAFQRILVQGQQPHARVPRKEPAEQRSPVRRAHRRPRERHPPRQRTGDPRKVRHQITKAPVRRAAIDALPVRQPIPRERTVELGLVAELKRPDPLAPDPAQQRSRLVPRDRGAVSLEVDAEDQTRVDCLGECPYDLQVARGQRECHAGWARHPRNRPPMSHRCRRTAAPDSGRPRDCGPTAQTRGPPARVGARVSSKVVYPSDRPTNPDGIASLTGVLPTTSVPAVASGGDLRGRAAPSDP